MSGLDDPLRFIKAEEFFDRFRDQNGIPALQSVESSQSIDPKDPLRYAALLNFGQNSTCLFQFVTPQLWRIRLDPAATTAADYPDANTRTIVQDSFASLVDELQSQLTRRNKPWNAPDVLPDSRWGTTFESLEDGSGWFLSSVEYPSSKDAIAGTHGVVQVRVYFRKKPFQIQCTRVLKPQMDGSTPPGVHPVSVEKVIWQTAPGRSFVQNPEAPISNNIVLNVTKPGPAEYIGFGEQGGKRLLKTPTLMNYFCYDNLGYSKVYGIGPLDDREPLYHSQPFFLELNGTPGYHNVTATLVDNYSQVFIDLGKSNGSRLSMGVRFGTLDTYILAADKVPQLIWLFTSIVGRPQLKPRYVLGHHQGGYGYENRDQLNAVISGYHSNNIPLDCLHIDVDFQHKYRTFTTDDTNFPNVSEMFAIFRTQGIKCCTNITPIISYDGYRTNDDPYPTINAAWDQDDHQNPAKNFLVMDNRYEAGRAKQDIDHLCYLRYDEGKPFVTYANDWNKRKEYENGIDHYDIYQNYNSGYPYHGGVSYGRILGIPGFYPDLNRKVVREEFWAKQYEELFNKGLEFVWQDMTTPAVHESYGDMLGFPGRLLMSTDPYKQDPGTLPPQKTAMELWSLYSYNLHKATYQALQNLPNRKNKRNFVIGRGSSTGMHRYAGLWTGDNRSTWDFWRISIAQVLACGLSGITIAGVDMGGFFPDLDDGKWCDPNLFIRWYSGAFLLPWYRNHWMGKRSEAQHKLFQEVYNYATVAQDYPQYPLPDNQKDLYASVMPICRYYVRLRYSLMQAMYDRMFENIINGLPLARSMLITDPDDTTLFNEAASFVDNQYLLGHYILVSPLFEPDNNINGSREIYLPRPNNWYAFNLRVDGNASNFGIPLDLPVEGGSVFSYEARIQSDPAKFPYITPIYVREGAFIPQIGVRLFTGDGQVNPITMNVYPGSDNYYSMFLDDGVSRSSAPGWLAQYSVRGDTEAKGEYREVRWDQKTFGNIRTLTIANKWNKYDPSAEIGDKYTIVLWMDPSTPKTQVTVTFQDKEGHNVSGCTSAYHPQFHATVLVVPIGLSEGFLVVKHVIAGTANGTNGIDGTH